MSTDVATFAKMLRESGIDAGKKEASGIIAEAKKEASKIIKNAKLEAEKAIAAGEEKTKQARTAMEEELKLVARDLTSKFKVTLEEAGINLLKAEVQKALNSQNVLEEAIKSILKENASEGTWKVEVHEKMSSDLIEVIKSLMKTPQGNAELVNTLKKAGFEASISSDNSVFEITDESVIESFKEILSPELKKLVTL